MKKIDVPSQEYLKSILNYNSETGHLIWRQRVIDQSKSIWPQNAWNTRQSGSIAGTVWNRCSSAYYVLKINGKQYKSHRIIWMMVYGEAPNFIDHIDGNGLNNRLSNLRSVTRQENSMNLKRSSRNKSGVVGVSWGEAVAKWRVYIHVNHRNKFLGEYFEIWDAICCRKSADILYEYHINHGRR